MTGPDDPIACPTPADWWNWLAAHPGATVVWLLYHRKASGIASIDWSEAVEGAIAHGWIDGVRRTVDAARWTQRFTPRKAASAWSQRNIATAERLIAEGRMTAAGLATVKAARAAGHWQKGYSGGKAAEVPQDFLDALAEGPADARDFYATLSSKNRYSIYYRLTTAKRPETRAKRIADYIAMLARGEPFH